MLYIFLGLPVRRDPAGTVYRSGAGVIRGEGEAEIAVVAGEHVFQILGTAPDVLGRIEG